MTLLENYEKAGVLEQGQGGKNGLRRRQATEHVGP